VLEAGATQKAATGDAVVIGAGMAGLAAARVLADRFARVTVVDRDHLPPGPDIRRGVPQVPIHTPCWRWGGRRWRNSFRG
jgi:NADPH-dependent 2,4-dienoyl-CoA reductase/sulfur reductase-like enzyme